MLTCDGHTYERKSIAEWLQNHSTAPITGNTVFAVIVHHGLIHSCPANCLTAGAELENKSLIPNKLVRSQIQEYLESGQGVPGTSGKEDKANEVKSEADVSDTEEKGAAKHASPTEASDSSIPLIHRKLNAGQIPGFVSIQRSLGI